MSGGYFDYKQYYIQDLIEQMEEVLVRLEKEPIDSYECDSLKNRIDNRDKFKEQVLENLKHLKLSYIYTQRIDWLVSGDDGEDSFYKRLEEELKKTK